MSLIGKIQTLFSDKEKTTPVFPRTKVSAVSDENGVGLDALLDATMQKTGGTFTGDVAAYSTNRTGANLRNINVVDADWTSQSTNAIFMVRK